MIRFAHLAWPGLLVAAVSVAGLLLHIFVRGATESDLFSKVAGVGALVGIVLCTLGTLGRIDAARDEEDQP